MRKELKNNTENRDGFKTKVEIPKAKSQKPKVGGYVGASLSPPPLFFGVWRPSVCCDLLKALFSLFSLAFGAPVKSESR
jgi:hypothetical protein